MEITQLRYFNAVVQTGFISRAAEAMFVTPPTISGAISQMEEELGVKLFVRRGHTLELTPQGERFAEYTNKILLLFGRALMEINESGAESPARLFLAVTCNNLWPDFLAAFAKEHPYYDLTHSFMSPTDLSSGLFTDRYCYLLGSDDDLSSSQKERLESILLFRDTPAVMVWPSHPFASRDYVEPRDLAGEKLI